MIREVFNSVDKICILLEEAGEVILSHFQVRTFKVFSKADGSSVTEADFESNQLISNDLLKLFPSIPILSEENSHENNVEASKSELFWLLDPLDGTTNFIKGEEFFSINLALIYNNAPVLGFLYLPCVKLCYYGFDSKAFKCNRGVVKALSKVDNIEIRKFVVSKRVNLHSVEKLKKVLAPAAEIKIHSSAQKFCFLIEGEADIYPCCNDVYEWDVAAGHAIISAIGGSLLSLSGGELKYGKAASNFASDHFLATRSANMLDKNKIKSIVDLCL